MRRNVCQVLFILFFFCQPLPVLGLDQALSRIQAIEEETRILHLLSVLDLEKRQAELIMEAAQEAEALRRGARNRIGEFQLEALEAMETIPREGEVEEGETQLEGRRAKRLNELKTKSQEVIRETNHRLEVLARRIENLLREPQLLALDGYSPGISRRMEEGGVSQTEAVQGLARILEAVQKAPGSRVEGLAKRLLDRIMERIRAHKPNYNPDQDLEIRAKIRKTFNAVRHLDPKAFQLQRISIAQALQDQIMPKEMAFPRLEKIKTLLLSSKIIPLLEDRIARGLTK